MRFALLAAAAALGLGAPASAAVTPIYITFTAAPGPVTSVSEDGFTVAGLTEVVPEFGAFANAGGNVGVFGPGGFTLARTDGTAFFVGSDAYGFEVLFAPFPDAPTATYALEGVVALEAGGSAAATSSILVEQGESVAIGFNGNTLAGLRATSIQFTLRSDGQAVGGYVDDLLVGTDPGVAPIPEPATWAMMILGFGAVGGVLRTRRAPLQAIG